MGLTLPPGGAGGLDADLYQHILGGPFLPAVIGCDGQLVLVFFAVAQLLCVLYITFQRETTVRPTPSCSPLHVPADTHKPRSTGKHRPGDPEVTTRPWLPESPLTHLGAHAIQLHLFLQTFVCFYIY